MQRIFASQYRGDAMTLMPIMSPVPSALLLGAWVSPDDVKTPAYDFTSISFEAGDLLVAVVAGREAHTTTAPSGFSQVYFLDNGGNTSVKVFTKTASGSETTVTNPTDNTNVATAAVRFGTLGASAGANNTDNPPAITNNAGDVVFVVMSSLADQGAVTAPSSYTLVGSEFAASAGGSFISFAYKERAPFSEDPGAFGGASFAAQAGVATFSITGA